MTKMRLNKTHTELLEYIKSFDAIKYGKSRNYINGNVSFLSPYITHGVITTKEVIKIVLARYTLEQCENFLKELLRREYFLQVHYRKWDAIFSDMEPSKTNIPKLDILSQKIIDWETDSKWINEIVNKLKNTWYLHNHQRMRFASYCTHYAKLYRKSFADWTYYNFLDGELGSNHLSRQWVESTFSHKPYFMNEENISKYRSGHLDNIYSGTYDEVSEMLFDPNRKSIYEHDIDKKDILTTDLSWFDFFDINSFDHNDIVILNPRDLHPQKIHKDKTTICILDVNFLSKHPWSQNRLNFVKSYTDIYGINIYKWDLDQIVSEMIKSWKNITMYQNHNPIYRQAWENNTNNINLIEYDRFCPSVKKWYINKFFWFWNKNLDYIYNFKRTL